MVIVELPDDLPLVRVDATLIEQALGNLLENAAKHTPAGTVIRLRAKCAMPRSWYRSRTSAPASRPRTSSASSRSSTAARRRRDRAPASACRSAARSSRLHGGQIWAERVPGGGTAFRFTLPLESRAGSAGRGGMTEPRPTILVVEDEPEIRRFLRSSLSSEGYRVVESANGARGSVDAGTHKPDLAIVDLGLPDIDGVEVIRRIRRWSSMPIIVLSARVQERSKIEALDAGADDYVTKPFGVGELLARVRVALRRASRPPPARSWRSGR